MKKDNFKCKLFIYCVVIAVLIGVMFFLFNFGKSRLKKEELAYTKTGSINYVTYLKNNSHYTSSYLEDDYNFVANLIDYFNVDYNYTYVLNESINYKINYEVVGLLEIYDSENDTKPIEKKTYQLSEKETKNGNGQVINVELFNNKIDYANYNKVIQEWKKEISPNATLKVTFNVNWTGFSTTLNKEISDSYSDTLTIPISDKTINISKPNKTDTSGVIKNETSLNRGLVIMMISLGFMIFVVTVLLIITVINHFKCKSKYEMKISKILREFDRAITEAKGRFIRDENIHYIEISEFMELMDVHDNLNEPIIYYKNDENSSIFTVRNGNDIYYWTINRKDYDIN